METKNYNSGAYPFYLRLYDCVNDNLEGYLYDPVTDKGYQVSDIQGITVSGVATIPNLRVLTSGEFWIYSNLTIDVPQADWYHIFTMAKVIPSYKVTASVTTISTFFNFKITVTLYDEYGNPFTLQPNIVLSMIDKSLGGNISGMVPASGTIDLACFFNTNTSSKDLVITTTSPVSYWTVTLDLTITNSVLVIDIPILPITSTDLFTVTVILKSSDLVETETKNGPYLIVLGLNAIASASGTSITGLLTADSVSGLSTFSSLRINSSGNFTLTAYLAGAEPATSEIFSVTNSVKRIYLESPTTVAPNELFIIRVILYGDDDQFFIQSAIITITTNLTSASSYQVTTTTGEETLVFYQANSGIYSIEASTNVNNVTSSSVFVTVTGLSLVLSTDKTVIFT